MSWAPPSATSGRCGWPRLTGARVERVVLLGGALLTSEIGVPRFIGLLRTPLGRLITRIPENSKLLGRQLAGLGHTTGDGPGQVLAAFVDWHVAMSRETGWARHERDMVRTIVGPRGYVPGLVLVDADLAAIRQPALMVYGTADPVKSVDGWRRFAGRLPHGELEVVDGGGHMPWYDDPGRVGARVARFLDS